MDEASEGTSEPLTPTQAASQFADILSGVTGTEEPSATPPSPESPETAPNEAEASTEQAEVEGIESTDEQSTDEEAEVEPEAPRVHKITVDGEEIEVTDDELLKGYSRTADYTRKTMKLAEERKALQADAEAVKADRVQYAEALKNLQEVVKQATPKEPDWRELQATMDPGEFAREYALWDQHKREMAEIQAERDRVEAALRKDQEDALKEHIREQNRLLLEAVPEWKDETKLKDARSMLESAAESVGYAKDDLNRVTDYRLLLLLRKAALYDASQTKRPDIEKRIEKVKTAPPGAKGSVQGRKLSPRELASRRLANTGSLRDAAAVMMTFDD